MVDQLPKLGKIHRQFFERVIFPRLGKENRSILVGPRHGVDVGIVRVGDGKVMAITTDPFFVVPQYGWKRAAWFAVHILASDLATSGILPQFMSIDLNLPPSMRPEELEELWGTVHEECRRLGIAVVTGHTGRYEGCNYPMVGGCTMIGFGPEDRYVTVGMSKPGDSVIVTKGAAIEATGLMAVTFPKRVAEAYGAAFSKKAEEIFWQMSTVKDALTAASVGVRGNGVTAMHDATECGVFGGLYEMAHAAEVGMEIDVERIPVPEEVSKICELFKMDPYTSISEGTLLLTCVPQKVKAVLKTLRDEGIVAARIGECTHAKEVVLFRDGDRSTLRHPEVDPFWGAFAREASR